MAFRRARAAIGAGLWISCGAVLLACAAPAVPAVSPADAQRAQQRWPGTTVAQLESGRSLYLDRCSACHLPPSPTTLPPDRWPAQVEEMKERAGLGAEEVALVERYLITMSAQAEAKR